VKSSANECIVKNFPQLLAKNCEFFQVQRGLTKWWENYDDKRIRFDTTPQRGGPTDREKRYNNIALCMLARMLTRDKNREIGSFFYS